MIDIHCHILPGIDDGPKDLDASLNMCRTALQDGVKTIIASPHHLNGVYRNEKGSVLEQVAQLQSVLDKSSLPLQVLPGSEVYMDGEMTKELRKGTLTTMRNGNKYLLVELPRFFHIEVVKEQLFEVRVKGLVPIISHPERSSVVIEDFDILYELLAAGALTQITSSSVTGVFGKTVEKTAEKILQRGMGHFVASDAHDSSYRAPVLSEAYKKTRKLIGIDEADRIFRENPERILQNDTIEPPEPEKHRKGFFSSFFNR